MLFSTTMLLKLNLEYSLLQFLENCIFPKLNETHPIGASIDKTRSKLETTRQMEPYSTSLFNPNQSINYFYYTIRQLPKVFLASACFHWPGLICWFHELLIG